MNHRLPFITIVIICLALLGFGYYLQFFQGLEPCPLCIVQRLFFMGVITLALLAVLHGPATLGAKIYGGMLATLSLGGAAVAARQVWLQHLPPEQGPECGPDLAFMMELYEPMQIVRWLYKGTGDCAEVNWTFLGLSIAEWALGWFVVLALVGLVIGLRTRTRE